MQLRKTAAVAAVTGASLLAIPVTAGAQTPVHTKAAASKSASKSAATTTATSLKNIPVTGSSKTGKAFKGKMNVTQFIAKGGKTYAVGTLTGTLGGKAVKSTSVDVPVTVQKAASGSASSATACPVLNLILGPLNLNLLGLQVNLNQVILNITAISGAGNLLGNLLCGVSNLLNTSAVPSGDLAGLLNIVTQLSGTPALLGL